MTNINNSRKCSISGFFIRGMSRRYPQFQRGIKLGSDAVDKKERKNKGKDKKEEDNMDEDE
jgi:hypothetical protein